VNSGHSKMRSFFFVFLIFFRFGFASDVTVAIDIGTTFSCVAVLHNGVPVVLRDRDQSQMMPSIVAFGATDDDVLRRPRRQRRAGLWHCESGQRRRRRQATARPQPSPTRSPPPSANAQPRTN
jgi:hypothetical protein